MNFGTLLNVAKKNSASDKKSEKSNYYSTKFDAPKKESKDRKLSANIQKFLQQQEKDEAEKQRIAKQKLDDLMASRDTKSKNKIKKMLKVTKSANKSVLDDAVDEDNTAYTLQGPEQPDEDDYGYVSHEAGALYKQLMDKYKACPEEKKFSDSRPQSKYDLDGTKDRVRAAIMREREEESTPHRRKRTSHAEPRPGLHSSNSSTPTAVHVRRRANLYNPEEEKRQEEQRRRDEQRAKAKNRLPPAPALDFASILKLAEKKQFEPVEVEVVEVKKKEPERLLTTKEKREQEERQRFLAEREKRKQERDRPPSSKESSLGKIPKVTDEPRKGMEPNGRIPKLSAEPRKTMEANGRIPKLNSTATPDRSQTSSKVHTSGSSKSHAQSTSHSSKSHSSSSKMSSNARASQSNTSNDGNRLHAALTSKPKEYPPKGVRSDSTIRPTPSSTKISSRPVPNANPKPSSSVSSKSHSHSTSSSSKTSSQQALPKTSQTKPSSVDKSRPTETKSRALPPADVKTRQFPPADTKTRQFPPADVKIRPFPPADVKTRQFPPADVKTRTFPPRDMIRGSAGSSGSRSLPPSDIRRSNGAPMKRPPAKRHVIEDDDSEYDSEMDDFIDDGPEEENYSKYIKEIFGYDKSRYKHIDDDVDNMESSFAQQMKEEFISKKIGLMEDLEDMRLEAEEKKRAKTKRRRLDDDDDY